MQNLFLIDFEDSFTLNIYSELTEIGLLPKLVDASAAKEVLEELVTTKEKTVVILGPGPGHPDERSHLQETLKKLMINKRVFIMGICLGHQLIASALGLEVSRSKRPSHGESEKYQLSPSLAIILKFSGKTFMAQRYNSLVAKIKAGDIQRLKEREIECLEKDGESFIFSADGLLTYQFHPESVGTSFRSRFFLPVKNFLL